ncbi:MAG: hypothetical protein AAGC86_06965 [Pseudomonadota bacterium]
MDDLPQKTPPKNQSQTSPEDTPPGLPWATAIALLCIALMMAIGIGFVVGLFLAGG